MSGSDTRFAAFLARNGNSEAAVALYERNAAHVSYRYYVAKKTAG